MATLVFLKVDEDLGEPLRPSGARSTASRSIGPIGQRSALRLANRANRSQSTSGGQVRDVLRLASVLRVLTFEGLSALAPPCDASTMQVRSLAEVGVMDQVVMDRERENESLEIDVLRQCPTCERCRDCGYTHIGIACPDANRAFDGTCLCDPSTRVA